MTDLSTVTQADVEAAQALWERDAPKKYKKLLRAQVTEHGQS